MISLRQGVISRNNLLSKVSLKCKAFDRSSFMGTKVIYNNKFLCLRNDQWLLTIIFTKACFSSVKL